MEDETMSSGGFTLVELMIVVAIVGVLAAVTTPEYKRLYRQTSEGMTRGNLGVLRSALSIYYSDNDGIYPYDNLDSLIQSQKYLQKIPLKRTPPYHGEGATVTGGGWIDMDAARGSWFYINDRLDTQFGRIIVNCVHQDLRGNVWSSY
jgi:prepilin-type N-terminal cleavage/methylation domain-containing protein